MCSAGAAFFPHALAGIPPLGGGGKMFNTSIDPWDSQDRSYVPVFHIIFLLTTFRTEKKVEERTHMARLFPGHARAAAASGHKSAEALRRTTGESKSTASRTAEAVKKSLDFASPGGADILNKIMAGMSGTILKKE